MPKVNEKKAKEIKKIIIIIKTILLRPITLDE